MRLSRTNFVSDLSIFATIRVPSFAAWGRLLTNEHFSLDIGPELCSFIHLYTPFSSTFIPLFS